MTRTEKIREIITQTTGQRLATILAEWQNPESKWDELDADDLQLLEAAEYCGLLDVDDLTDPERVAYVIDWLNCNYLIGRFNHLREFTDDLADDLMINDGTSERVARYFDYTAYADDVEDELNTAEVGGWLYIFNN